MCSPLLPPKRAATKKTALINSIEKEQITMRKFLLAYTNACSIGCASGWPVLLFWR